MQTRHTESGLSARPTTDARTPSPSPSRTAARTPEAPPPKRAEPAKKPEPATRTQPGNQSAAGKPIELVLTMPQARGVSVAGTFNNWDCKKNPMNKDGDAGWKISLNLPPGRYEYRFFVDGTWMNDPKAKESTTNPFGSTNSVLVV